MEALRVASDLGTYPTLVILFRIFATIPITTATAERSFSNLKFIKNYLRSTMMENRLNGLSHLFINRDIKLDNNKVIDQFGGEHNRRLKFRLPELQPYMMLASDHRQLIFHLRSCAVKLRTSRICLLPMSLLLDNWCSSLP